MSESKITPKIRETEYGIRKLKKFTVYPLSIFDQKRFAKEFFTSYQRFAGSYAEEAGSSFIDQILEIFDEKIEDLFLVCTDFEKDSIPEVLRDMDNDQLTDFAQIVWEVNFEIPFVRKENSLMQTLRKAFGKSPIASLPQSSEAIPKSAYTKSTSKGSKKGVSRKIK